MTLQRSPIPATTRRKVLAAVAATAAATALPTISRASRTRTVDVDRFVQDCIDASRERDAQAAVLDVLARAVSDPAGMLAAVHEPSRAGISILHRSKTLTILNAGWTPQMNLMPHNHLMWGNIGIYTGREDNIFWWEAAEHIEAFEAKALFEGDVAAMPADAIHSVTNPLLRFTGGIHIYGGDFFATTRSQWDPETLAEEPSDGDAIRAMFQRENERLGL